MQLSTVDDYIERGLTHSIHTTERRSFRGCRRRWNYVFRQYYYPTETPRPLEFGVAFHVAMEVYYNPETWHDKEAAAALSIMAFKAKVEEQFEAFEKIADVTQENIDDYDERLELGLGMLRYYFTCVSPYHDNDITPVKVEIKAEVPIPDPNTGEAILCKCAVCWRRYYKWTQTLVSLVKGQPTHPLKAWVRDWPERPPLEWEGLPVSYGLRIDMLGIDKEGGYWIFDWKTTSRMSQATLISFPDDDFMLMDDQITSYCWALATLGINIRGFVYVEIKKGFPQEPEPMKVVRKGLRYSTNKNADFDYETYKRTVEENDPGAYQAGLYDEFLEYLEAQGNATFHKRSQIHRSQAELDNAGVNIGLEALDIIDPSLRIYPNPGRFNCTTCAFQLPCLGTQRNEDVEYYLDSMFDKRKYHYYEDAEPTTDKRKS